MRGSPSPLPHGVFLGAHAVAEGLRDAEQLRRGLYRRVLRDVYADPGLPSTTSWSPGPRRLLMPADAALAGRSAAVWLARPYGRRAGTRSASSCRLDSAWRGPAGSGSTGPICDPDDVAVDGGGHPRSPRCERTAWDVATLEKRHGRGRLPRRDGVRPGICTDQALPSAWHGCRGRRWGSRRVRRCPRPGGRPGAEPAGVLGAGRLPPGGAARRRCRSSSSSRAGCSSARSTWPGRRRG